MLNIPLEFGEKTIDGHIMSRLYPDRKQHRKLHHKSNPQPPFRIECANAQIEQRIAAADVQFNIGTYTFRYFSCTVPHIISFNRTQFHEKSPSPAQHCKRHHDVPHVEMTLAMKDEMKKRNLHPIQIKANGTTNSNRQCRSYNQY